MGRQIYRVERLCDKYLPCLLGPLAWRLRERLGEEPDWNRRLSIVEGIVYRRLLECPAPDRQTAIALRRIAISHGSASMAGLAAELDCSRKHLVEMFHRNVGIAPKTYARMVRFHRVRQLVMSSGRAMADIALECGFSDQAHMSRDFLEFSGETPSRWKHRVS